jgi:hypothetical protein
LTSPPDSGTAAATARPGSTDGDFGAGPGGPTPASGGPAAASPGDNGTPTENAAGGVDDPGRESLTAYELAHGVGGGVPGGISANLYGNRKASLQQLFAELAPTVGTAGAGAVAWAAFSFLGKRRRDDDEPDDGRLAAAAASGYETDAAPGLEAVDESLLPRWRRPSLQQVRRTDPLRAMAEAAPCLSFESAGVRPLEDYERRHIGYRLVRLLDSPDEFRSREIGILDQGDEVQLLERHGVYWLVLCPDGRQGWVHRMTLADSVRAAAAEVESEAALTPNLGDEPSEILEYTDDSGADGLLEAYMTARRDVLRSLAAEESVAPEASTDGAPAVVAFQSATFAAPRVEEPAVSSLPTEEPAVSSLPTEELPSAASPAAGSEHAGERYSARKSGGSRKAATGSRPGTRSRRPSR